MSKVSINDLEAQLSELELNLLDFEKRSRNGENVADSIHTTFQHIHNIKSNLFLINHEKSLKLTYYMENHFEKLRSGDSNVSSDMLHLFNKSVSWIKMDICSKNAPENSFDDLINKIELKKEDFDRDIKHINKIPLSSDVKALLRDSRNCNMGIFVVEKEIDLKISRNNYRNLPLINRINEVGLIVTMTPEFNEIRTIKSDNPIKLKIIFVTDKTRDELKEIIEEPISIFEQDLFVQDNDFKILIIEDNPVALLLQRSIMGHFGICDSVPEGASGLDLFQLALNEKTPYDIILLDLVLPGMGGADVLKSIRKMEEEHGINGLDRSKVIVSTSTQDSNTLMNLFRAETDAYIIKPLTKDKLEKEMRNLKLI